MILKNRNEWAFEILHIGEAGYVAELERILLKSLNAKDDTMSFNQHNGDGLYNGTVLKKIQLLDNVKVKLE